MGKLLHPADTPLVAELAGAAGLSLGWVFALSALPKVRSLRSLFTFVRGYGLLPRALVAPVAYALLTAETLLAVAFIVGVSATWLGALAGLLLLVFLTAALLTLVRGARTACGCFGDESEVVSGKTVARLALLAVGVVAYVTPLVMNPGVEWSSALLTNIGAPAAVLRVLVSFAFMVGGMWLLALPQLLALPRLRVGAGRPSGDLDPTARGENR